MADPSALPPGIALDDTGQLQCTACHNPHNNAYGNFLVTPDAFGALCTACHSMHGWPTGAHRTASATIPGSHPVDWPYETVAENACMSCHRAHTAGGQERLLIYADEEQNCLICHNGLVADSNIETEIDKYSAHDPRRYTNLHDPTEGQPSGQVHVECADCHNPHAVAAPIDPIGYIPIGETLSRVQGVTTGGALIDDAQYEYEVCLRCHGDTAVPINNRIPRLADSANLRLDFGTANPSFHPVVTSSPNMDVPSLVPGLPPGSMIRCTDCHSNDAGPGAGGGGPAGPHGSIYDYLLERNYSVIDHTSESQFEYAMCYKCHERSSILSDESFEEHSKHIEGEDTPCSACHDPHGISLTQLTGSDHTHLINFDTTIVFPEPNSRTLEFRDLGRFAGSCTLTCHGEDHVNEDYGP